MKIIKEGIVDPVTKRFECKACGCIFEANRGEYRASSNMEIMVGVLPAYKCACPTCRKTVYAD